MKTRVSGLWGGSLLVLFCSVGQAQTIDAEAGGAQLQGQAQSVNEWAPAIRFLSESRQISPYRELNPTSGQFIAAHLVHDQDMDWTDQRTLRQVLSQTQAWTPIEEVLQANPYLQESPFVSGGWSGDTSQAMAGPIITPKNSAWTLFDQIVIVSHKRTTLVLDEPALSEIRYPLVSIRRHQMVDGLTDIVDDQFEQPYSENVGRIVKPREWVYDAVQIQELIIPVGARHSQSIETIADELALSPADRLSVLANEITPGSANDAGSNAEVHLENRQALLIPAWLLVDQNRDGQIDETDLLTNSAKQPFRFWSNDDDDGAGSVGAEGVPATRHDNQDAVISNNRDLEDFARLQLYIGGLQDSFTGANPPLKLALKWKNTTGTPRVRLFKQPDGQNGSDDYVRTDDAADAIRHAVSQNTPILVDGTAAVDVPASYLSTLTQTGGKIYTVFEGVGEGKGQLILVIKKADGIEIGEGPGVWLDIKNIKSMYDGPGTTFTKPADEQRQAIVFVHGWNMSPEGSRNFAETAFKRLWHRGYKGRFTYFRWNTNYSNTFDNVPVIGEAIDGYLADYNGSERVAWQSGAALKAVVDALPAGYSRNLMAHSMGNIVAGSALLSGMTVDNYALLQAAVPASCYDDRDLLKQPQSQRSYVGINVTLWENATPDDDPVAETRALAYRGRLTGNRGNLINFYLPNDAATVYAWELNNDKFKPALNYGYTRGVPPVLGGQQALWKQIGNGGSAYQVRLTDPLEAMPFADASWSKVVGSESRTAGAIKNSVDLSSSIFSATGNTNGFNTEHSAEFNRNIQILQPFYDELLDKMNIPRNQ